MLDHVKKYRDAAAWVVLALVVGAMIFGIVRIIVESVTTDYSLGQAALSYGGSAMGLTSSLIVLIVVVLCLFVKPTSPMASVITLTAAIVVTVGTLATLVFAIIGLTATMGGSIGIAFEVLGSLTDVVLKALVSGALWVLVRGQRTGVVGSPQAATTPSTQPSASSQGPSVPPQEATGSAWKSANDAAKGTPGVQPDDPGTPRQWRPVNQRRDIQD